MEVKKEERVIKVGIVTAVEDDAWIRSHGEGEEIGPVRHYRINNYDIFLCRSGVGRINAAVATQYLISTFLVDVVINYGTVGALSADLEPGEPLVVNKVADYQFDLSGCDGTPRGEHAEVGEVLIPVISPFNSGIEGYRNVICASGDSFVTNRNKKMAIQQVFNADVVDMESAGVALACLYSKVHCIIIKSVADTFKGGSKEYEENKHSSSDVCVGVLNEILV